jgi:hypothetical protein
MHTPPRAFVVRAAALVLGASLLPIGVLPPLDSLSGVARAAILQPYASQGQFPVAPGVTHDWGTVATGSGQQVVNFVEVQPGAPGISFDAALSNDQVPGLERPSSEANRKSIEGHRAIAAVNGDVWSGSSVGASAAPFGIHIENGELDVAGSSARPTFGVDANGQPLIGAPVVMINLITPDGIAHPINRINQHRNAGEYVLYTPRFGAQTEAGGSGTEVVLAGVPLPLGTSVSATGTVAVVRAAGSQPIEPGDLVVAGPADTYLASLVPGTTVQLVITITAGWETAMQAIGGREFLLRDGATDIDPHPSIADQHHPRTAIGVTATGAVILAVVDGRNAGYSAGVTDAELASVMAQQGAVNAINLDGGNSTAMSLRQPGDGAVSIVNRPSGGSEQAVSNALLLFSAAPTGPLAILSLMPASQTIYATSSIAFGLAGQDATYNPVALVSGAVTWSAQGLAGTFDSTGRFTATAPGSGTITARTNGIQGSTHLTVLADTTPPVAQPPLLSLVRGAILGSTVPVQVSWPAATDVGVGVAGYELRASVNGGSWKTVSSGSPLTRTVTLKEARGANYRYADRARDAAGNVGGFATAPSVRVVVLSEASGAVSFNGGWSKSASPSYDGRVAMSTRAPGASATYTFVGSSFAWVSAVSPVRGSANVYVDGTLQATVSLYSKPTITRQMVFTKTWASSGRHTVRIVALGTSGHPRVDVDALVVLAPPTIGILPPTPTPTPTPTPLPTPTPTPVPTSTPAPIAHVVIVWLENKEASQLTASSMPYLYGLSQTYGRADAAFGVSHPSEPNYLALWSGSTQGVTDDANHDVTAASLSSQLTAAGKQWRVYAQNYPATGCNTGATYTGGTDGPGVAGTYARKHNPAISFTSVSGNPTECAKIQPLANFSPTAASVAFVAPNLCNDAHDCSLAQSDSFLQAFLPSVFNSPDWAHTLLIVTFDEGSTDKNGGGNIFMMIARSGLSHVTSSTQHNHYGVLHTIENTFGLSCLGSACRAAPLSEFLP